ncbi:MAG: NfeD family protein [Deltaproteobacteria bacterium]|nr:NfeD family protein [Deltaproteobacteria bacterium]
MTWWAWVLFGVALLVVEMVTPGGLFALFFGIGAIAVGVLSALGISGPPWLEWVLFGALSVALMALLRSRLRGKLGSAGLAPELAGEVAVVIEAVPDGGVGKAELRGTPWEARAAGPGTISAGQRCRVERVDGLTLVLRPE